MGIGNNGNDDGDNGGDDNIGNKRNGNEIKEKILEIRGELIRDVACKVMRRKNGAGQEKKMKNTKKEKSIRYLRMDGRQ